MTLTSSAPRTSLDRLLRPRSVAIIGASPTPGAFGASVLANLERASYPGELFLINPRRANIGDRVCMPSVEDLPAGVDCAVLAIPRHHVVDNVRACARRDVGAVIIFSAGFADAGEAGRADQDELRKIARESGMVIEGPNCLGFVNYIDGVPLTFVTTAIEWIPKANAVAIISQSGAMAAVLGVSLRHHALNISFSISTGNEAANGVEDFVEYMIGEPHSRVMAMIVEQFRQPRRFLSLVKRAREAGKTIVLLHPGSSSAARSSAATHTGVLAGDYALMRAKVEHAGVLTVDTLEELADVCDLLIRCPSLPRGGAAVFTESGAFKALTLDFAERLGLALPPLSEGTERELRAALPDFILPANPLDITAHALTDPGLYRRTLPPILADPRCGSVMLAIILTDESTSELKLPPILEAIRDIRPTKPVIFVGMDEGAKIDPQYVEELRELGIPFFPSPERALRALARLTAYSSRIGRSSVSTAEVAVVVGLEPGVMPEYKSKMVLQQLGITIPAGELAKSIEEARTIASRIGYPVVLKAQAASLVHKSDVGGVALNLGSDEALAGAWQKMHSELEAALPELVLDGILVESMSRRSAEIGAECGVEIIVGARNDPDWGPVLLVGFGGVLAEAMNDVRLLAPELSIAAIEEEIHLLKSAALLRGFRGSPALDVGALADIVHKLGQWMLSEPAIREVDINPVIVYPQGAVALDALIVTNS